MPMTQHAGRLLALITLVLSSGAITSTELKTCSELDLRVAAFFKVGTASLHLADCAQARHILDDIPKQFSLDLARDFAGADLTETANELLVSNLGLTSDDPLPASLACLANAYVDAQSGDRYDVVYDPDAGLALFLNDELLQRCDESDQGEKFFLIWFGDDPFHERMRDRLIEQALSRGSESGAAGR